MSTTSQRILRTLSTRLGLQHLSEIREATGLTVLQVHDGIQTLARRGFVERLGEGKVCASKAGLEWLAMGKTITSGPNGPRPMTTEGTSLRFRLWRAIRLVRKGTIADLLELAERGSEGNAYASAKEYLNALVRSGHLIRMNRRGERQVNHGETPTRYCITVDSGPLPPQYNRHQKRVFDPNTGSSFDVA